MDNHETEEKEFHSQADVIGVSRALRGVRYDVAHGPKYRQILRWIGSGYRRVIPELQVRDRAFQVLLKLGTRFGLDPSSREGLGVANQTSPDFAEEFLFKPL